MLRTRLMERVPHMPGFRALPAGPPLSVIERPRCQHCQIRTILRRIAPGPAGYEFRTFACPKCDGAQRNLGGQRPHERRRERMASRRA
jgi:hypothetical protein